MVINLVSFVCITTMIEIETQFGFSHNKQNYIDR